ncbi:MAG: NAD-dependent epimerase/dehydratase family protein [Candidatus Sericytochromatia bacterium]
MRILITGGAGFIGSTLARRLLADGHAVTAFDNLETGATENLPGSVRLIEGDIRDRDALDAAMAGHDAVAHLAAMVSVAVSVTEPARCWDVNVVGTRQVLDAARAAGIRRVALASSAAVYGNEPTLPKREDLPVAPASPYAYSKWHNEVDAGYYGGYLGLETVCLRFFNVYGPRQRPDSPYSGVISIAADRLLSGKPFTVNGTGEQTRDFVFSEDVAGALAAALTAPGVTHEVINVGRGERVSLLELLAVMGRAVGCEPELAFGPPRAGDVLHSVSDPGRLAERLGYRAGVSLETGLTRTIAWMRDAARA